MLPRQGPGGKGGRQLGLAGCCGWEDGEVLGIENEASGSAQEQGDGASVGSPGVLFLRWDQTY